MRAWADLARAGQAFRHLRALLFGWQEHLSDWIFKYAASFPSLCYIIVTDCPQIHQRNRADWEPISQAAGWDARHAKRSAKSLRPIISPPDFHFGSVSGCYYDSTDLFDQLTAHRRRPDLLRERRPVLEVWMAGPRQWSHIVDDFPSTRTIFYENVQTKAWMDKNPTSSVGVGDGDPTKRLRDQDTTSSPGTASPPPKRGPVKKGPAMRTSGKKDIGELLRNFQT
jgi:hypothetical protein